MLARHLAADYPVIEIDSDASEAARLLAEYRLPGLVVTDRRGRPLSILPASQVVRFLVPGYVQENPALARVLNEAAADQLAQALRGWTVRELLPRKAAELAVVRADDTVLEVAAAMARLRCPLAVVMQGSSLIGVITATLLLQRTLAPRLSQAS